MGQITACKVFPAKHKYLTFPNQQEKKKQDSQITNLCCQVKSTFDLSCVQRQLCRDVVPSLRLEFIYYKGSKIVSNACALSSVILLYSDYVSSKRQSLFCPAVEVIRQKEPFGFVHKLRQLPGVRVPTVNMAEELLEIVERLQSRLLENPEPRKVRPNRSELTRCSKEQRCSIRNRFLPFVVNESSPKV